MSDLETKQVAMMQRQPVLQARELSVSIEQQANDFSTLLRTSQLLMPQTERERTQLRELLPAINSALYVLGQSRFALAQMAGIESV